MSDLTQNSAGFFTKRIVGGGLGIIEAKGDFFYVIQCPIRVGITRTGASEVLYDQGNYEQLPPGSSFSRLEITNPTTQTVDVLIYAGFGRYGSQKIAVYEPNTQIRSKSSGSLAAAGVVDLTPVLLPGDLRRKAIVVTNGDATARLNITDMAGNRLHQIFPLQNNILPVSDACKLKNPSAGPVDYDVCEIWWTT